MTLSMDDILKGTQEVLTKEDLQKMLASGKPLNVKLGVDPTSADLHLGHAVVLRKLKQFQEAGHQVYLVIGDFTASIGDPAGVNKTRPVLTESEIRHHMQTYVDQAEKILDMEKTHIVYNSEWLKTMNFSQFLQYAMQISVNQLVEREDFGNRLKENQSVGLHEFIYPVVQGIDSVFLKADIEIGGFDQLLNMLTGRDLQRKLGMQPQVVVSMKALIGTDGEVKMSKSKGNYIGITENANQMFGKLMRIPDKLIDEYADSHEIDMRAAPKDPRNRKAYMARAMVEIYNGTGDADKAMEGFDQTFKNKTVSEDLIIKVGFDDRDLTLIQAVTQSDSVSSSEARRLIEQNAIKVDEKVMENPLEKIHLGHKGVRLQVGKHRFFELHFKEDAEK